MKKYQIIFIVFILAFKLSYSQDIDTYQFELNSLEKRYLSVLETTYDSDELSDKIEEINSDASSLVSDIEDFISENSLYNDKEAKYLKAKADDFESLTFQRPLMDCYPYFQELLSKYGTSEVILKQSGNVRVCKASIGNFDFFYTYAKDFAIYPMKVILKGAYGLTTNTFSIVGNIVILDIAKKNTKRLYKVEIGSRTSITNTYYKRECQYQFPRF